MLRSVHQKIMERNGRRFHSYIHLNSRVNAAEATAITWHKANAKGFFYFHSGQLIREEGGQWHFERNACSEGKIVVQHNCVDKIKVIRVVQSSAGSGDRFNIYNGLHSVQNRQTGALVFQQEVCRFSDPPGMMAKYKKHEKGNERTANSALYNNSRVNVNIPRGIHELTVLNKIYKAHAVANGARVASVANATVINNTSITADSVINSVRNGITFKTRATQKNTHMGGDFKLSQKAAFGTHKMLVPTTKTIPGDEAHEALAPLFSSEIQVHEHCFNCSAVHGYEFIPQLAEKTIEILEAKNIHTDLAVNNAKAYLERAASSLMWTTLNSACDLMAWRHGTYDMEPGEQVEFAENHLLPVLAQTNPCRDSYGQAGPFCQQPVKSPSLRIPELKQISHKFGNPHTKTLFEKSQPRFPHLAQENEVFNSKRPMTSGIQQAQKKRKYCLASEPARNEGIVRRHELGMAIFRRGWTMKKPQLKDL